MSDPKQALGLDGARHLLLRTGWGPRPDELRRFAGLTRQQAIATLLRERRTSAVRPLPAWVAEPPPTKAQRRAGGRALRKRMRQRGVALKAWWLTEMVSTPSPLSEKMLLFWHGHFTTSQRKVRWPTFHAWQNATWRRHALGRFDQLLADVLCDPAMLLYLDQARSHRRRPNENLARELLELFTLGEGHYSERDIKELARALTGATIDPATGRYRFGMHLHDWRDKAVLGTRAPLKPDDVAGLLLRQPRTATWIVGRLWRFFVSTPPPPRALQMLAEGFRKDWRIDRVVAGVLAHPAFWRDAGRRIKSPVELLVGAARLASLPVERPGVARKAVRALRALGQDLMDPPSVKGWPQGEAWIDTATLARRQEVLSRMLRLVPRHQELSWHLLEAWWDAPGVGRGQLPALVQQAALAAPATGPIRSHHPRALVRDVALDLSFQLT